ncbi:universal stress protein [Streptomyces collinus]|uniref:UspA domain-containing protein n=1 Tax=Streptomyces collinus TaxID=42684 RepID=A0AA89PUX2_STRCU|nr:universal stress protein [Streptomyces collinus]MBB5809747.1 hypothetical protein [Streptomyces collinus]WMX63063.1 universal stress protein [Streptomyces collinus]
MAGYNAAEDGWDPTIVAAKSRLSTVVERSGGRVTECDVLSGPPAQALMSYASEQGIDLIVVGTHGRGLSRRLLGNVAQELVRQSTVPVLVAGPRQRASRRPKPAAVGQPDQLPARRLQSGPHADVHPQHLADLPGHDRPGALPHGGENAPVVRRQSPLLHAGRAVRDQHHRPAAHLPGVGAAEARSPASCSLTRSRTRSATASSSCSALAWPPTIKAPGNR